MDQFARPSIAFQIWGSMLSIQAKTTLASWSDVWHGLLTLSRRRSTPEHRTDSTEQWLHASIKRLRLGCGPGIPLQVWRSYLSLEV